MADTKLVFRNSEERELWMCAYASHAARWANCVEGVYGTEEQVADSAVLSYRERCGESATQPTRDEGPWAVWIPRMRQWRQYALDDGDMARSSVLAFFDLDEAKDEAQRFDDEVGDANHCVVAPFPRTLAEVKNGPAASGGGE